MARKIRFDRRLGMLLLAVWLIGQGLASAIHLDFNGIHVVLGVLALVAGVLLLIDR